MKKFKKTGRVIRDAAEAEPEKKKLSTSTIFAFIAIIVMIASGIGYMWEGGNTLIYNGFKFKESGDKITTKVNGRNVAFSTLPDSSASINASKEAFWVLKNTKMAYMTSDPESPFKEGIAKAQFELQENLANEGIYSAYAFTEKNEYNITEIMCKNATIIIPVVYFTNSTATEITYDNGCIILGADSEFGFIALKDRLMYGFYGIIG